MNKYTIEGTKIERLYSEFTGYDLIEAVKSFKLQHSEAKISYINGKEVIGFCEDSGMPIFYGDDYSEDEYGVMWLNKEHEDSK